MPNQKGNVSSRRNGRTFHRSRTPRWLMRHGNNHPARDTCIWWVPHDFSSFSSTSSPSQLCSSTPAPRWSHPSETLPSSFPIRIPASSPWPWPSATFGSQPWPPPNYGSESPPAKLRELSGRSNQSCKPATTGTRWTARTGWRWS